MTFLWHFSRSSKWYWNDFFFHSRNWFKFSNNSIIFFFFEKAKNKLIKISLCFIQQRTCLLAKLIKSMNYSMLRTKNEDTNCYFQWIHSSRALRSSWNAHADSFQNVTMKNIRRKKWKKIFTDSNSKVASILP